jgi:uncharacterized damage-inducible protein DinB
MGRPDRQTVVPQFASSVPGARIFEAGVTRSRVRPAFVADERTQLVGWLDMQRELVHWKCEGLSDADAHRSVVPSSPLMTMAGVVSHLRWVEHCWFEVLFLGRPAEGPQFQEEPDDADMIVDGVALEQLLHEFEQQCKVSNEIIASHSLDDVGMHPDFGSAAATLRWMLIHMVEEVARHVGQMDIIRELLDGSKGYY